MNREHLWTFLWLRWRLRVNQVLRAGTLNAILTGTLVVVALVTSLGLFAAGIVVGAIVMPQLSHAVHMYVWAGAILLFLFCWLTGLLAELQRSEALAIDKFLHLPVSPAGAFLVNYLSSFFSLTLILLIPGMIGLALGQVYSAGPIMLLALPLLAAFVLAATALTYQFQGWLASMMANPRRRRTVIVLVTAGVVLLVQIPNLVNIIRPWDVHPDHTSVKLRERHEELSRKLRAGEITGEEFGRQTKAVNQEAETATTESQRAKWAQVERTTRLMSSVLPPGWVVLGAADLAGGQVSTALLGILGLGLIGVWSLSRAYRTTLRIYTVGGSEGGLRSVATATARSSSTRPRLVEWALPWVSEDAAGVATAGFRSLLRAPETKMLLITPLIMVAAFGGVFVSLSQEPSRLVGPFIHIGVLGTIMVAMMQLAGNQFGLDRDGFRAFVLSPVPRREILLGKNLSLAPIVLALGLVVIIAVAFAFRLSLDQVAASLIQLITMYLLFCLLSNLCSIFAPFAIPSGSLKASRPGLTVMLILMGCIMVSPVVVGLPTALPVIVEVVLEEGFGISGVPVSLGLSLVILAAVVCCYRRVLSWEGRLLSGREQRILEVVTGGTE